MLEMSSLLQVILAEEGGKHEWHNKRNGECAFERKKLDKTCFHAGIGVFFT